MLVLQRGLRKRLRSSQVSGTRSCTFYFPFRISYIGSMKNLLLLLVSLSVLASCSSTNKCSEPQCTWEMFLEAMRTCDVEGVNDLMCEHPLKDPSSVTPEDCAEALAFVAEMNEWELMADTDERGRDDWSPRIERLVQARTGTIEGNPVTPAFMLVDGKWYISFNGPDDCNKW